MKVYFDLPETKSRSLWRVQDYITRYLPQGVVPVDKPAKADVLILHVIGRRDRTQRLIKQAGRPYAIIQYAVRSTKTPDTTEWIDLWRNAELVWSFYNLDDLCEQDDVLPDFYFYHSPLGADKTVFYPTDVEKKYIIATSGLSYVTESVREAALAARRIEQMIFHLGPELNVKNAVCGVDIPDFTLRDYYNQCHFVSGLRRVEGFEMPAAEGLLCGCRPIFFDRPHYRQWFDEFGVFIPEGSRGEVIDSLERVFRQVVAPVTKKEIKKAQKRFDWQTIIGEFWTRLNLS